MELTFWQGIVVIWSFIAGIFTIGYGIHLIDKHNKY